MNVVWLILDSLSFSATPFYDKNLGTMPHLSKLAQEHAHVFTEAYAPGPASPSSHASFLTGRLPSETGMHEASPYFDGRSKTIANHLENSHESLMISSNPFIFNGLQSGFKETEDLKFDPLFEEAMHPLKFTRSESSDGLQKYLEYLFETGQPIKSLFNGIHYKLIGRDGHHRHAKKITQRTEEFISGRGKDSFVLANYMDVHPPLEASDKALKKFAPDTGRQGVPIGVDGEEINNLVRENPEYDASDMYKLYHAAIWDLDRTIAPLVRERVAEGDLVIITADHGQWFDRKTELDEDRIHVPLLIFHPSKSAKIIPHTVNLRSLPKTIMEILGRSHNFDGSDLTKVDENQVSVTEFIHDEASVGKPVTPTGNAVGQDSISYKSVLIQGEDRIEFDGETTDDRGKNSELENIAKDIFDNKVLSGGASVDYDKQTENRLRELGYLE